MSYNASSTYKTFLMHATSASGTYTKVCDIKSFPDLGADPTSIETTTLTDSIRTSVNGIQDIDSLPFEANYDPTDFQAVETLATADEAGASYYAVYFGGTDVAGSDPTPTGNLGQFKFKGSMSHPYAVGGGVNEARGMRFSIALASKIELTIPQG